MAISIIVVILRSVPFVLQMALKVRDTPDIPLLKGLTVYGDRLFVVVASKDELPTSQQYNQLTKKSSIDL
jgi:hypothetical protein